MVSAGRAATGIGKRAAAAPVTLNAIGASDSQGGSPPSIASVSFGSTGLCDLSGNGSIADYTWMNTGVGSNYDIKVDVTSGTFNVTAGNGTWLSLGTTRVWTLSRNTGAASVAATVQIRDASTLTVLAGPVSFNFDVDVGDV